MGKEQTRMNRVLPSGIITLTTDFGLVDPYVAIMKGVILSLNPQARIVDITHQLAPGDIRGAAIVLKQSFAYFPQGTVHVVVLDPGVGTTRRPVAFLTERYIFVGPDNGVLGPIITEGQGTLIHLNNPSFFRHPVSSTFHGRDIFAPVAAKLSAGADVFAMGEVVGDPVILSLPRPARKGQVLKGEVIKVDRFGNLITNIEESTLRDFLGHDNCTIAVGPIKIENISRTYGDVAVHSDLALIGSSGFLEISVNQGRASDRFENQSNIIGTPVIVKKKST